MPAVFLKNRSLVHVGGLEAQSFLQNLITTDIASLPADEARPGALLTPQGKILFDFMIWRDGDGFVLETDDHQRDALLKRLTMYKLRAAVDLSTAGEGVTVSRRAKARGLSTAALPRSVFRSFGSRGSTELMTSTPTTPCVLQTESPSRDRTMHFRTHSRTMC